MHTLLVEFIQGLPILIILSIIAACLFVLGKGADMLVEEAVTLSLRHGISKVIIGATIVSLGTTLPEVTVSVMSAINGKPDMALGNAVGSVICDTGLILGAATLFGAVPLDLYVVRRQGLFLMGLGVVLVLSCLPYSSLAGIFETGGRLPQIVGFVFLGLLAVFLWVSTKWAKRTDSDFGVESHEKGSTGVILTKILVGITMVIASSHVLIIAVEETAIRANVPQSIIAATLVAFGTSLPELVTSITAVRKGHGELAVGNVIGADILNILLVAGASAAVTKGGLQASPNFFTLIFPAMIGLMIVFQVSTFVCKTHLTRISGACLLGGYALYLILSI